VPYLRSTGKGQSEDAPTLAPVRRGTTEQLSLAVLLPPPALPCAVAPFPCETLASYLARLACANHIDAVSLRRYIVGSPAGESLPAAGLAAAAGIPAADLTRAIAGSWGPEPPRRRWWRAGVEIIKFVQNPACRQCTTARGAVGPVITQRPAEDVICLRHQRWTGWRRSPEQPSLADPSRPGADGAAGLSAPGGAGRE
jgi:hypothetical protein